MTTATLTSVGDVTLSPTRARLVRTVGFLGILAGGVMLVAGAAVWVMVSTQLGAEQITVSDDSPYLAGAPVNGPLTAFAEAEIINHHALAASEGLTYAQLEQDDPIRATVMNASFLRASLFTSVVSYGVSALVMGLGLILAMFGWTIRSLVPVQRSSAAVSN